MPDFLGHAENPLREDEWARLNETVIQVARRSLVGRRILDIYGPLGAGVQTVPHDEYTGVSPGAVDIVGEQETASVFTDARKFKTIPIIYKDFLLHWRDIEAARLHNMPLDVSAAAGAAALCAQQEDELIFYGDPKLGHEGLMNATGRLTVPLGDWATPGSGYLAIVEATRRLNESGHYGPYAVVLSPRLFSMLHRIFEKTGVLEIETIRQLAADGVYQSNRLRGDSGVVVSTGRENMDLAVAMDMVAAYLGASRMNHPFRVLESLILRIKHPDSICTLESTPNRG
ncbi:putative linocin/CFP29 family protein [Archangium gephyra]|uniref:Encapsulating protein for a DyP-type peroxidase or ferritin-like protein oligomers n=1 Tax=Archangium gephyra TaxID=48 RepID=A0AAC8TEY8_9BACT|nr:family 1 encapsulin nanocompartment shell protein [Archangium gephyra]AKJ03433.1 Encapsulating protein for a DyP-type peroxidase or ferritin-like protein oligomers [Archangium gephyra]REG24060.1 putative linocin/CFP29 family protein [Archangium gephyra]